MRLLFFKIFVAALLSASSGALSQVLPSPAPTGVAPLPPAPQPGEAAVAIPDSPAVPIQSQVQAFADQLLKSFDERNLETLAAYMHPEVLMVWPNAEITRGHAEWLASYQRNFGEAGRLELLRITP